MGFVDFVSLVTSRWLTALVGTALVSGAAVLGQSAAGSPDARWWMREPVRFLQTNLSETDSTVNPKTLVTAVAGAGANTFLMNMGGIVAQYPTRVPFHYPSAFLPAGRDLFGDVLRESHARGIRDVGRFDLSKTQKPVFDAHPEWFFKRSNGDPAIYNGLYSTCINGRYYREHALTILAEALDRYDVDGLFFNMFGNPASDYSGVAMGPCQCDACQTRYRAKIRQGCSAERGRRLSAVHGGVVERSGGGDCGADSSPAARGRVSHLHHGSHRRHHVGVQHRRRTGAPALACTRRATT